jgi:ubiquinone/menaquinone biosynthesis C-methylase UbiE
VSAKTQEQKETQMVPPHQVVAERQKVEEEFHDIKARAAAEDFYSYGALTLADNYLFESLGDLHGKRLLEIGCGIGEATVKFAQAGAIVTAIDISGEMIEVTKERARKHGLQDRVEALKMGGEDMAFPDDAFDIVYGHSILHHLNLDISGPTIARILKQGGFAAFLEPLDYNPILALFRRLTPHRRTPTEQPLRWEQFDAMGGSFSTWTHREFYLLSLAAFVWYYGFKSPRLFWFTQSVLSVVDRGVFSLLPFTRRFAWVTVVRFAK